MAIKKPVTTADIKDGVSPSPTRDDLVADVEELTSPDVLAKPGDVKYVRLTSPLGQVSVVPEEIADALKASGYKAAK